MKQIFKIGLSLWAFFVIGIATGTYEHAYKVGNGVASLIGIASGLLIIGTTLWLDRSEA